jgi:AcrR family transcriptional regulator
VTGTTPSRPEPEPATPVPLREQQRAHTRGKLMESARHIFAVRGYPSATVDEIAREASASRATFYLHFRSKAEIAAALVDDGIPFGVARYHTLDRLLCANGPDLARQLHEWLSEWTDIWTQGADASHAMLQAAILEPEVEARRLQLSAALIDGLSGYFEQMPESQRAAARERALVLEIMTQQILAHASMGRLPVSNADMLAILVAIWLQVLVEDAPRPLSRPS